jgi:hypothetical protein
MDVGDFYDGLLGRLFDRAERQREEQRKTFAESEFKCSQCGEAFLDQQTLDAHTARYHSASDAT